MAVNVTKATAKIIDTAGLVKHFRSSIAISFASFLDNIESVSSSGKKGNSRIVQ